MAEMRGINRVVVAGVVEHDPRGRRTAHGTWMAKVQVRTRFRWTDRESGNFREEVERHHIVVFGADAQRVMEEVSAGDIASFEGRLRTVGWTDDSGQARSKTEIVSESAQLMALAKGSGGLEENAQRGAR